jgi:small basic protein (TIGR04137 family)
MSIHRSLKRKKNRRKNSVLKRYERFKKVIEDEKWKEGQSIYHMPKYNMPKFKTVKKIEKEESTKTTLGGKDIIQEHLAQKERMSKEKKQRKDKKETTGVR